MKAAKKTTGKRSASARAKPGTSKAATDARHAVFVEAYIATGGNGTQAAIEAGYGTAGARVQACRMLRDPNIASAIKRRRAALAKRYELTTESILAECTKLAFSRLSDLFDQEGRLRSPTAMSDHALAAIASIEVVEEGGGKTEGAPLYVKKIKLWDKNAALERLMKHLGLFEKDNRQKADPVAQLMQHIAEHDTGWPVRP